MKKAFLSIGFSVFILVVFSFFYQSFEAFAYWFWSHKSLAVAFFVFALLPLLYGLLRIISLQTKIQYILPFLAIFFFTVYFFWSYSMENFLDPYLLVFVVLGFVMVFRHEKFLSTVRAELK